MKCKQPRRGPETTGSPRAVAGRRKRVRRTSVRTALKCNLGASCCLRSPTRRAARTQNRRPARSRAPCDRAAPLYMSHDCNCLYQLPGRELALAASWRRPAAANVELNHHQAGRQMSLKRPVANAIGVSRSSLVGHELGRARITANNQDNYDQSEGLIGGG